MSSGAAAPRWYLPVRSPLASGKNGSRPSLYSLRGRQQILFDVAHHQAVFVLARHEPADIHLPRGEFGFRDPPRRKIRIAEIADLALPHQIVERAQGFVDRRQRIVIVLLVEIDVVGLQPGQAGFDRGHDVAPRRALLGAVGRHRLGIFGRQHDVLAAVAEHLAQHGLGAAHAGVDVGGIEQRDAEIDRLVDHLARGFQIGALAEIIAAEADRGDAQAGAAEITNLHGDILSGGDADEYHIVPRPSREPQGARDVSAGRSAGKSVANRIGITACKKRCGPGQTRRLTGTALGRVIVTGGLIKRRRKLAVLCYAAMTA